MGYSISGSGTHGITTGTAFLSIDVTTFNANAGSGRANPTNWFDLGLLRLGNANGYARSIPVDADPMLLEVPSWATTLGYAMLMGSVATVTEIAGATEASGSVGPPASPIISAFAPESLGPYLAALSVAAPSSGAYFSANAACAYPLRLSAPFAMSHLWWVNGGVVSGHTDVGLYDSVFNRLASTGSQANSGAAGMQAFASALNLAPGLYWLAIACDNTTQQFRNSAPAAPMNHVVGSRTQATAFPLPNPFVPSTTTVAANIYVFGISSYNPP